MKDIFKPILHRVRLVSEFVMLIKGALNFLCISLGGFGNLWYERWLIDVREYINFELFEI